MKQLIGGVAGALVTGIAILGWNGHAASDQVAWTSAQARGPVSSCRTASMQRPRMTRRRHCV